MTTYRLGDYPCYRHSCASSRWIRGRADVPSRCTLYGESSGERGPPWGLAIADAGRLNSRAGVFALSLATWHGLRIVGRYPVGANLTDSPTHLTLTHRRALLAFTAGCLESPGTPFTFRQPHTRLLCQLASMKLLKPFLPSLYSEYLLSSSASTTAPVPASTPDLLGSGTELQESKPEGEGDLRGPGGDGRGAYDKGLGETFGFPGDARKMRERSKMKLWKEYFTGKLDCLPARQANKR
jgi:hypothetical protein